LVALGLDSSTVVAVTSDHGESFGQHGWFYHGFGGLYEEDLHSPLVIMHPRLEPGRTKKLGSHIDLWPTLAALMHVPPSPHWQGVNLLDPSLDLDRRIYFARSGSVGLREGDYKFVWDYLGDRITLVDLENDATESVNLANTRQQLVGQSMTQLGHWVRFQNQRP
jgi:arylsulfatase A-like enzyme